MHASGNERQRISRLRQHSRTNERRCCQSLPRPHYLSEIMALMTVCIRPSASACGRLRPVMGRSGHLSPPQDGLSAYCLCENSGRDEPRATSATARAETTDHDQWHRPLCRWALEGMMSPDLCSPCYRFCCCVRYAILCWGPPPQSLGVLQPSVRTSFGLVPRRSPGDGRSHRDCASGARLGERIVLKHSSLLFMTAKRRISTQSFTLASTRSVFSRTCSIAIPDGALALASERRAIGEARTRAMWLRTRLSVMAAVLAFCFREADADRCSGKFCCSAAVGLLVLLFVNVGSGESVRAIRIATLPGWFYPLLAAHRFRRSPLLTGKALYPDSVEHLSPAAAVVLLGGGSDLST